MYYAWCIRHDHHQSAHFGLGDHMKHRQVALNKVGVINSDGHAIGLDIGAMSVRAAVLAPGTLDGRPSVTVHGIGHIDLPPGTVVNGIVVDQPALTSAIKRLWREHKFECRNVILGIANQQVVVRDLETPNLTPQQRAKALPFQAREIIALPIDQVVLDFAPLGVAAPGDETVHGLLLAAPREPILIAVQAVEKAGLNVARVDLSAFAALRSIADEALAVEAVIDLGAQLSTIIIHNQGVPKLVRTLPRGGQELTEQLAERMDVDLVEAEAAKVANGLDGEDADVARMLNEALRPLLAEIRTSIGYFRSNNEAPIARISLTGGGSALSGIAEVVSSQTGLPTRVVDPMQHVRNRLASVYTRDGVTDYGASAVAVGLAMGAAA
jgi:type IV pilus assembly protein PilM